MPPARVTFGEYHLRWEEGHRFEGDAVLEVVATSGEQCVLFLPPLSIAIREPSWGFADAAGVQLGTWGTSDGRYDRFGLVVPQSGRLSFRWEPSGIGDTESEVSIPLQLIPSNSNRLILHLPPNVHPTIAEGALLEQPGSGSAGSSTSDEPADLVRWVIALPGRQNVMLRLQRTTNGTTTIRAAGTVSQHLQYEIENRDLMLTATFEVREVDEALQQLTLNVDPGVLIESVMEHGRSLNWWIEPASGSSSARTIIELPERDSPDPRTIVLKTRAPLELEQPWVLPRLAAPDLSWIRGHVDLVVPGEFELLAVHGNRGRDVLQTGVTMPADVSDRMRLEFAQLSPMAVPEVVVRRRVPRITSQIASRVELGPLECHSRLVSDMKVDVGQVHVIRMEVAPEWTIESVTCDAPDALQDWYLETEGELQVLSVQLNSPLEPRHPLRMTIDARLSRGAGAAPIDIKTLQLFGDANFEIARHVCQFVTEQDQRLLFQGQINVIDAAELTPGDASRLERPDQGRLVLIPESDSAGRVGIAGTPTAAVANIEVDVVAAPKRIDVNYRFRNRGSSPDEQAVLVAFDMPLADGVQWSEAESQMSVPAEMVNPQKAADAFPSGQVWKIHLDRSGSTSPEFHAHVSLPGGSAVRVPLPRIVGADEQTGHLVVRNGGDWSPVLRHRGFAEVLSPDADRNSGIPVLGSFRYDATTEASFSVLAADPANESNSRFVEWAELATACAMNGVAHHQLSLRIVDQVGAQRQLRFPNGARIRKVRVDDVPLAVERVQSNLVVPVALATRAVWIHASYDTPLDATAGLASLESPLPELDAPVLAGRWTVWSPPGIRVQTTAFPAPDDRLNWRKRLFGPLARSAEDGSGNPLMGDWWPWQGAADVQQRTSLESGQQVFEALRTRLDRQPTGERRTWADVLNGLAKEQPLLANVLVDANSLAQVGILPSGEVPDGPPNHGGWKEPPADPLKNLAIIVGDDEPILTSRRTAALVGRWVPGAGRLPIFISALPLDPRQGLTSDASGWIATFLPLTEWALSGPETLSAESGSAHWAAMELPLLWQAEELPIGPGGNLAVMFARDATFRAFSWTAFLFATGLAALTCRRRRPLVLLAIGISIAACLLVPVVAVGIPRATAVGFAVGLIVGELRRAPKNAPTGDMARTAAALIAGVVATAMCGQTQAQDQGTTSSPEPVASQAGDAEQVQQILIPVDEAREPVGSKYFVNESLLVELRRRAALRDEAQVQWLIQEATYTCNLGDGENQTIGAAGKWKVELQLHVFARDTIVKLPFRRSQAAWDANAFLDGLSLPLVWDDGGNECWILVSEPGPYQLVLSFLPKVLTNWDHAAIEIDSPRVADTQVQLSLPAAHPPVELKCGLEGVQIVSPEDVPVAVSLGPVDQLSLRWSTSSRAPSTLVVDEFIWLRLTETGAFAETKLVTSSGETSEPLPLRMHPPLSIDSDDRRQEAEASGDSGVVNVPVLRPESARSQPPLSFQLAEADPIGRIQVPALPLEGAQIRQRWLAINCDSMRDCRLASELAAHAVVGDDEVFLSNWGSTSDPPQQVFQLSGSELPWQIVVQPVPRQQAVDGTLWLVVGPSQIQVQYNADIRPGDEQSFGQRVRVPKDMAIREVTLTQNAELVPIRWARRSATELALFFGRRLDDNYQLTIAGVCPIEGSTSRPLPEINALPNPSGRCRLHLFREDDTQIALSGDLVVPQDSEVAAPSRNIPGSRLVGTYWIELDTSTDLAAQDRPIDGIGLRVVPNIQQVVGESLTSVFREGGRWMSTWIGSIRVQEGVVDTLEVRVPEEWDVQGVLQSELAIEVLDESEPSTEPDARKVARIRFPDPLTPGDTWRVELRGRLRESWQDGVTVPRVEVPQLTSHSSFISVPLEVEGRPAQWTRVGVDWAGQPPMGLQPTHISQRANQLFRVVDEPFLMRLQTGAEAGADAIVSLTDVQAFVSASGEILAETKFVLEPQGLEQCTLELPPGWNLVDVLVGGVRCRRIREGAHSWTLSIPSPRLPHVLKVTARCETNRSSERDSLKLARPRLLGTDGEVPTELTVWSIATPGRPVSVSSQNAATMQPVDHALLKLSHFLRTAEAGATLAIQDGGFEAANWSKAWHQVLEDARRNAAATIRRYAETSVRGQIPTQLPPHEQLQEQVDRFQAWVAAVSIPGDPQTPPPYGSNAPWRNPAANISQTQFITEGGPHNLTLHVAYPGLQHAVESWLVAATVVLFAAVVAWALGRPAVCDWGWQFPQALGVLSGWLWWLFLSPAWVAPVIIAVSLFAGLQSRWTKSVWEASTATAARPRQPARQANR